MSQSHSIRFDEVLEAVEACRRNSRGGLIDMVRRRQIERRGDTLAASIQEARRELAEGAVAEGRWTSCSASSDP